MVPVTSTLQRTGPGLDRRRGGWGGPAWLAVAACAVTVALIARRRVAQPR